MNSDGKIDKDKERDELIIVRRGNFKTLPIAAAQAGIYRPTIVQLTLKSYFLLGTLILDRRRSTYW